MNPLPATTPEFITTIRDRKRSATLRFKNPRIGGTSSAKPRLSVTSPGVINMTPATRINNASTISDPGIRPAARSFCTRSHVRNPCRRASDAPTTPVTTTSRIVGPRSITPAMRINSHNSTSGIVTNSSINHSSIARAPQRRRHPGPGNHYPPPPAFVHHWPTFATSGTTHPTQTVRAAIDTGSNMRIAEMFHSIQGEGKLTGTPSLFIRTSGCNLRCRWCDTPYTSWDPEGEPMTVDEIIDRLTPDRARHVVLTGGEPMIWPEVTELTRRLHDAGCHITLETAATVYRDVTCDLASLSPKLAGSTPRHGNGDTAIRRHRRDRLNPPVIQRFMDAFPHQLKFVVDAPDDLAEIDALLQRLRGVELENVLLMPQGVTAGELDRRSVWLADICKDRGFRFCPRLHIMLYGNTRGT